MPITVSQPDLARALNLARRVTARTPTMPILGCACLGAANGVLTVRATRLSVWAESTVPCVGVLTPTAVPTDLLARIVAVLDHKEFVSITEGKSNRTVVESGSARFDLTGMAPSDFPACNDATEQVVSEGEPAARALAAAARVAPIAHDDSTRAFASGVWIALDGAVYSVLAVDGQHAVRVGPTTVEEAETLAQEPVCVPKVAVQAATDLAATAPEGVRIRTGSGMFAVEAGTDRVVARCIAAELPSRLAEILPPQAASPLRVDRARLIAAVRRVASVTERTAVVVSYNDVDSTVIVETLRGSAGDECEVGRDVVPSSGQIDRVGFISRQLLQVLDMLSSTEVAITVGDEAHRGAIRIDGAEGEIAIEMPLAMNTRIA